MAMIIPLSVSEEEKNQILAFFSSQADFVSFNFQKIAVSRGEKWEGVEVN